MTRGEQGFTLLELMISLMIFAMMLLLVFTALNMGTRAWNRGEKYQEQRFGIRLVPEMIRQQFAAITLIPHHLSEKDEAFFFTGRSDGLAFFSASGLVPEKPGPFLIHYTVKKTDEVSRLFYGQISVFRLDPETWKQSIEDFAPVVPILDIPGQIVFEYLQPTDSGEPEWQESMENTGVGKHLPLAIRMSIKEKGNDDPFIEVFRPMVTSK